MTPEGEGQPYGTLIAILVVIVGLLAWFSPKVAVQPQRTMVACGGPNGNDLTPALADALRHAPYWVCGK